MKHTAAAAWQLICGMHIRNAIDPSDIENKHYCIPTPRPKTHVESSRNSFPTGDPLNAILLYNMYIYIYV